MRTKALLVTVALLAANAAGAQVAGSTTGLPPIPDALPAAPPPALPALPGVAPLEPVPPAAGLPAQPGPRVGAGRTSAAALTAAAADRPAAVGPNPRVQELERKSRDIDRRVMRSICSGC